MIQKFIIFAVCLYYVFTVKSQTIDYIPYFQHCAKAEVSFCKMNIDSAFIYYEKAFSLVNDPKVKDLYNATICAAILQKDSIMFDWLQTCLAKGVYLSRFQENLLAFESYFNDDRWQKIQNQKDSLANIYISRLDSNYISALEEIDRLDQEVRKKLKPWNRYRFPNSKNSQKKFARFHKVNNFNQLVLDCLIASRGYPCEQNIGIGNSLEARTPVCIRHYKDSVFLFEVMFRALHEGKLSPRSYANEVDYSKFNRFGFFYANIITENERVAANQQRNLIGLPTLEEDEIIRDYYRKTKNSYRIYTGISFFIR